MSDTVQNERAELSQRVADTQNRTLVELAVDILNGLEAHRQHSQSDQALTAGREDY